MISDSRNANRPLSLVLAGQSTQRPPLATAVQGATIVNEEIAEHFEDNMLVHGHTYAGHPVTVAAGLAAIETYERENLIEHANEVGAYLGESGI